MSVSVRILAAVLFGAAAFSCFADVSTQSPTAIQNSALRQYQRALIDSTYPVVEQMQQNRTNFERMVKQEQKNAAPTSEKLARFDQWLSMLQADIQGQRSARVAVRNQFLAGTDPAEIHTLLETYECHDAAELGQGSFAANLSAQQTVWIALQSDAKYTLQINTAGSDADTKIAVYDQHCPNANQAPAEQRDDDLGLAARFELPPGHGQRKFLAISADQAGKIQIRVTLANGSIRGKVTTPLVNGNSTSVSAGRYENGYFSNSGYAYTESNGTYSISVPANNYYVIAGQNGYYGLLPQLYPAAPCYGQIAGTYCPLNAATLLTVPDGSILNGIDFNLTTGGVVSGRVTGQRVGETPSIAIYFPENTYGYSYQANMDSVGRFRITGLPTVTIKMSASANGARSQLYDGINCAASGCDQTTGVPIPITVGTERNNINFNLEQLPTISGNISGGQNYAVVTAYTSNGYINSTQTDATGNYSLTLNPGSYFLSFGAQGFVPQLYANKPCLTQQYQSYCSNYATGTPVILTAQASVTINASLIPQGSLSGRVINDLGAPVSGAVVRACAASDQNSCTYYYSSSQVQTNQTGDYAITGLPAGGYYVIASSNAYLDKAYPNVDCQITPGVSCDPQFSGASLVAVEDNSERTGISFTLDRSGSISGRLGGLSYYYNMTIQAAKLGYTAGIYSQQVAITSNNTYKMFDLPAGEYRLIAGTQNSEVFPQIFANRNCAGTLVSPCQVNTGDPITLDRFANLTGKDFNFSQRYGASGYVRSTGGAGIPNAIVDYWLIRQAPLLPERGFSTLTDSQGRFFISANSYSGSFYLSTDAPSYASNQIYQGVQCAVGTSAYAGTCSFAGATALSAPAQVPGQLDNIVFTLPTSGLSDAFFAHGFESRVE